jgi:hypothetical protein
MILLTGKEVIMDIRQNRDDNNHVSIIAIGVDSQTDEWSGRPSFFDLTKNPEALDLYLWYSWTVAVI